MTNLHLGPQLTLSVFKNDLNCHRIIVLPFLRQIPSLQSSNIYPNCNAEDTLVRSDSCLITCTLPFFAIGAITIYKINLLEDPVNSRNIRPYLWWIEESYGIER